MVISAAEIFLVIIVIFGVFGVARGVRATALTTGAIFFAIVVMLLSGGLIVASLQKLGFALAGLDTQDIFLAVLFVVIVAMAAYALGRLVDVPRRGGTRKDKLQGGALGLLNGFLITAMIDRYITEAIGVGSPGGLSVGVPGIAFSHPTPNTWSVSFIANPLTLTPGGGSGADLWSKLPYALLLLLLFIAIVFVGTVYGRLNRSKGRG